MAYCEVCKWYFKKDKLHGIKVDYGMKALKRKCLKPTKVNFLGTQVD